MIYNMTSRHVLHALYAFIFSVMFFTSPAFAQTGTLTGKVTNATGSPLAGATVAIKNTKSATNTSEQGIFSFSDAPQNGKLVISFIGFATQEVSFHGGQVANISMQETAGTKQRSNCDRCV